MGRREDLIAQYADDLRTKCGIEPDMDLLAKVTVACGPAIYDPEAAIVSLERPGELESLRRSYLVKKLGLADSPSLNTAIHAAIDTYGNAGTQRYRAVVYYILCRHFGRESAYR